MDPKDQALIDEALRRARIGLSSRLQALAIYGFLGVQVGIAMALTGTTIAVEDHFGPWARFWLGITALAGGGLTVIGALIGDRTRCGWWATFIGANVLGVWCSVMAVVYTIAAVVPGVAFGLPGEEIDPLGGRLFIPILYVHLAILLGLHVVTLIRLGRPRSAGTMASWPTN